MTRTHAWDEDEDRDIARVHACVNSRTSGVQKNVTASRTAAMVLYELMLRIGRVN